MEQENKRFQQYLNPLIDRIQGLEQKNIQLEGEIARIISMIEPAMQDPKPKSTKIQNNTPTVTKKNDKPEQPNKVAKIQPPTQKPDSQQKKVESLTVEQVKLPEKKQPVNPTPTPNPKTVNPAKKDSRERITSTKPVIDSKPVGKEQPKKQQIKKQPGATPIVPKKGPVIQKPQPEPQEKTEVIVEVLDYVPETPQKEKKEQVTPCLPAEEVNEPVQQVVKASNVNKPVPPPNGKPSVVNGKPRVSANQNKQSLKKIEEEVKQQKISSKKNIKGSKTDLNAKVSKALKQSNKEVSIVQESKEETNLISQVNETLQNTNIA